MTPNLAFDVDSYRWVLNSKKLCWTFKSIESLTDFAYSEKKRADNIVAQWAKKKPSN
jgi:hypothetical protein